MSGGRCSVVEGEPMRRSGFEIGDRSGEVEGGAEARRLDDGAPAELAAGDTAGKPR